MYKKNVLCLFLSFSFFGCATLKSQVQNDPSFDGPIGNRVSISIKDKEGKDLSDSMVGKVVKSEASKWIKSKGFVLVEETKKADQSIFFGVDQQTKDIYVPGQTYSIPVYGNNSGTTTTVKGAYGQKLGTIETAPSNPYAPTGYQTHYREGYTATVTDRWLFMAIYSQKYGRQPSKISEGQVYPAQRDQSFFESSQVMGQAVDILLGQSPLASAKDKVTEYVSTSKDPGCWLRLGISFDDKDKPIRGVKIKDFSPGNKAEKAGLTVGDVIFSIGGVDMPSEQPIKFSEGRAVSVLGQRDGKDFRIDALPSIQCIED